MQPDRSCRRNKDDKASWTLVRIHTHKLDTPMAASLPRPATPPMTRSFAARPRSPLFYEQLHSSTADGGTAAARQSTPLSPHLFHAVSSEPARGDGEPAAYRAGKRVTSSF